MNISSISNQNTLSQMLAAQQASSVAGISSDDTGEDAFETAPSGSASGASGNALTGSATGTLESQTLQALLNLTQTDPSDDSNAQTQGAKGIIRHHHHGGGMSSPADLADLADGSSTSSWRGQRHGTAGQ